MKNEGQSKGIQTKENRNFIQVPCSYFLLYWQKTICEKIILSLFFCHKYKLNGFRKRGLTRNTIISMV